jgi:drug/metabolite transporter (DMT)-like permease
MADFDTAKASSHPEQPADPSLVWSWIILLAGGISLGTAPILVKGMPLPPESSAFFRVLLSAPFFMVLALWSNPRPGRRVRANTTAPLYLYLLAAFFFAADLLAMHIAIKAINTSIATLFTNAAPLFIAIYGLLGLTDRPDARFGRALPLALGGLFLLVGIAAFDPSAPLWGYLVGLAAGGLYAAYLITVRALKSHNAGSAGIMVAVTIGSTIFLSPLLLAPDFTVPREAMVWLQVMALVVFGQVLGQGLVTVALRHLPVASSSIVLMIQPVFVAAVSWPILGEFLSGWQLVGMLLVLMAMWIVVDPLAARRQRKAVQTVRN